MTKLLKKRLKREYGKNWKVKYMQMSGNYSNLAIEEYLKRYEREKKLKSKK
jgi:hypothetical protein